MPPHASCGLRVLLRRQRPAPRRTNGPTGKLFGKVRWKVRRPGRRACYATPCVYHPAGRPVEIIFSHSYQGIWGVNPQTGHCNWKINVFGTFKQRACGSPVVSGDLVVAASGFTTGQRNLVVVRPAGKDDDKRDGGGAEEVYRISRGAPHVPTPLVRGGRMYLRTNSM